MKTQSGNLNLSCVNSCLYFSNASFPSLSTSLFGSVPLLCFLLLLRQLLLFRFLLVFQILKERSVAGSCYSTKVLHLQNGVEENSTCSHLGEQVLLHYTRYAAINCSHWSRQVDAEIA